MEARVNIAPFLTEIRHVKITLWTIYISNLVE